VCDFSVITPSYNYGHYIEQCLQSVAGQEGASYEHLVMDAGSSDGTAEVCRRFPGVAFFQEPDDGMSDGINKGFKRARGTWVMWLNADDMLRPGALLAVKRFAEQSPSADVIYGCWNFVDSEGSFIRRMTLFPFQRGMLANSGCYIGSTSTFYKRESTIEQGYFLDTHFRSIMDGEFFCRLARSGKVFKYLPVVLADFRLHDRSISQRNLWRQDLDGILAHQIQLAELRAIHRVYGIKLFKDEMLNGVVEGIVYHAYRALKGILKVLYVGKTRG